MNNNDRSIELALQEFDVEHLEDMDAPGWSDVLSAIGGASLGGVASYAVSISVLT